MSAIGGAGTFGVLTRGDCIDVCLVCQRIVLVKSPLCKDHCCSDGQLVSAGVERPGCKDLIHVVHGRDDGGNVWRNAREKARRMLKNL